MKRRNFVAGAGAIAATAALGCEVESVPQPPATGSPATGSLGTIDATEAAGLQFMREEEKLARDVYLQLGDVYGLMVFENISKAEQRHMDAVLSLLDDYGIEDPVAGLPVGKLVNEELQALHDELVSRGMQSREQALRVGALIEEVDILDLRERVAQTDESAIHTVYGNLERGSRNHLRAFVRQLDAIGVSYQPERLSLDDFESIISSEMERGGGRTRRGRGRRGGGGGRRRGGRGWGPRRWRGGRGA